LKTGYSAILGILVILPGCGCASMNRSSRLDAPPGSPGDPGIAKEWNERGIEAASAGRHAEAAELFRRAIREDPSYAAAQNNLGIVLVEFGRFRESAIAFATAARLEPRASEPRINLGNLYQRVGWHDEAVAEYQRALALDPDSEVALGHLAHALLATGNTIEVREEMLKRLTSSDHSEWKSWALAQLDARLSGIDP
jgi:tetratricopeptide (TPR) repeat protein